jgi:hypothetical protein
MAGRLEKLGALACQLEVEAVKMVLLELEQMLNAAGGAAELLNKWSLAVVQDCQKRRCKSSHSSYPRQVVIGQGHISLGFEAPQGCRLRDHTSDVSWLLVLPVSQPAQKSRWTG